MKRATMLAALLVLLPAAGVFAQESEYLLNIPSSEEFTVPYTRGIHSGARGVSGPYDLDGDGLQEVLVTDYTGGGRVHVIENAGADTWELVYMTPWVDSTASTSNARYAVGADLDGDGNGEIIFVSGHAFVDTVLAMDYPQGLYVYEYTGSENDYGDEPAFIYTFPDDTPDRVRTEQMAVADIDGDDVQELLLPNNGSDNAYDNWYVLSVTGDIGSGFEAWVEEVRISSRATEEFDPVNRGGGSPTSIHPADLDGDGTWELSLHSWNSFDFLNGDVVGADSVIFPEEGAENGFLQASSPDDHVSLFGGTVVDINGDGDDEVFYPRFQTGSLALLNYEEGEDVLQITPDQFILNLLEGFTTLGITSGDLDGDGHMELIGAGPSFGVSGLEGEEDPVWIRVAEFIEGDPEDSLNYAVEDILYFEEFDDDSTRFDVVMRDSAGVMTEYLEAGTQGPEFVAKLAYLGDPDSDGFNEVALAFQGVDDSTFVYQEVFNADDSTYTRTVVEATAYENRVFMRVLSGSGLAVSIEDERIVVPSDYKLHANYPNPFNPSTTIGFTLPLDRRVSVKVYDVAGRLVNTLVNDQLYTQGTHEVTWDGRNTAGNLVASGTYLYTLEYGNFRQSRTMILIK